MSSIFDQRPGVAVVGLAVAALLALPGSGRTQEADTLPVPDTAAGSDTVQLETRPAASDSTANFVGKVASAVTGKPISGARVSIPEIQYGAITDEEGNFRIEEVPPGLYDVRVHYLGYSTNQRPVQLRPGRLTDATFLLERDVLTVADIKVEIKETNRIDPMSRFKRRMKRGFGEFITREEIEKRSPDNTSDLLRTVPGVTVGPVQYGRARVTMRGAGQRCRPVIIVDGVKTRDYPVDNLEPNMVQGIEVYTRSSSMPARFNVTGATCGVVVIHTRSGPTTSR